MSKQVYIILKMRGVPYYGFPQADKARDRLRALGLNPVSPADLDRAAGFDAYAYADMYERDIFPGPNWDVLPCNFDLQAAINRDNKVVDDPETVAVYVVHENISESKGGMAEIERAMKAGKIILFDTMSDEEILRALGVSAKPAVPSPNADAKTFYTDPVTGGRKETKLARFDLLPPDIVWELAEHYGKGAAKYGDRNMEKGYPWSKTYAACQRHLSQFWRGEDIDAETGSLHLIAAAWHCLTMAWFIRHGKGVDDRPKVESQTREAPASN